MILLHHQSWPGFARHGNRLSACGSYRALCSGEALLGDGGGGLGGLVRGKKKFVYPKSASDIGPLINFIFVLRTMFVMRVGRLG